MNNSIVTTLEETSYSIMTRRSTDMEPSTSRSQGEARELAILPSLWRHLPEELLERLFAKLPFESLVRLRRVCKRWNHVILSGEVSYLENPTAKCVPVHFGNGAFKIYNSITKDWQEQSLAFLSLDILTNGMSLIATAGGLLCFHTYVPANLVICNPLTRRFKQLEMPQPAAVEAPVPQLYTIDKIQVAMRADTASGNYEVLVAATAQCDGNGGSLRGRVVGYDSASSSWKQFADVPRDILFWLGGSVFCSGSFYCLAALILVPGDGALWEWMLMKYDIDRDCWSVFPVIGAHVWQDHARIVEYQGSILLVTKASSNISIHRLDESRSSLWVHLKDLPLNVFTNLKEKTSESLRNDIWWCICRGELLFIIDPCREQSGGGLIVLVHDLSKNTWDWIPMLEGNYDPHHLCPFEPSLASP
ncbi:hypothetical protein R1flu_017027 [Riccia fluitans]|uniref:F-box domain-containing protein n=1 Tax=Riccia fluitans TaxID=41844 RepID=A0ABD1YNJ1_9MARC